MKFLLAGILLAACGGGNSQTAGVEAPVAHPEKTYAIHLWRPSHVGERSHVVIDQNDDTITSIAQGDAAPQEKHEKHVTHFDAVHTVAAVDDKGHTTRSHYEVKELVVDGKALAHGLVDITNAPKEEDATIVVDGAPANKEVHKKLESLLNIRLGGPTDDEIFGTTTPQRVGARWPTNGPLAREDLKDNAGIEAQSVTGEARLEGTTRVDDVDCLDVRAKLNLDGMSLPDVKDGSSIELSHAEAEMTTAVPLDGRRERLKDGMSMTMELKVRVNTPNGPARVVVQAAQTQAGHFTPL